MEGIFYGGGGFSVGDFQKSCLSLNRFAGSRIYWDNMQNV